MENMQISKETTLEKLRALGQQRLCDYILQCPEDRQEKLIRQIAEADMQVLRPELTENKRGHFEPLRAMTLQQIAEKRDAYTALGLQEIRAGHVGAVLLAGGQGSRLGFAHPKGMFNIGIHRELYIFECLFRNLMRVTERAEAFVPLFIMTSADNDAETKAFLSEHNYFGYPENQITFFVQEQLPTLDPDGNLMLAAPDRLLTAPNGNGGWYASMEKTGVLEKIRQSDLVWLNVFAVDNVLQSIADPCFIGAVLDAGTVSGAKVVSKAAPDEKVGVLCLEDGRPSIAEYYEMTEEMRTRREPDGTLSYNYGVILNYLFRLDKLDETLAYQLPLHRAFKKIAYCDTEGRFIKPDAPNAYKFETLALDMVKLQDDCLPFEVDRIREFAPVKNAEGVDSVETARALLRQNGVEL